MEIYVVNHFANCPSLLYSGAAIMLLPKVTWKKLTLPESSFFCVLAALNIRKLN